MSNPLEVTITAPRFALSAAFYDAVLAAVGLARIVEAGDEEEDGAPVEAAAWGSGEDAMIWLVSGQAPTRGLHIRMRAESRADVEAFHAVALACGGRSHDAPRRWPIFRAGEFNAIVADPDGNLIEAVARE